MHYCTKEVSDILNSIDVKNDSIYFTSGEIQSMVLVLHFNLLTGPLAAMRSIILKCFCKTRHCVERPDVHMG